jgi:molybdopterin-biosynthesis enzyme MoeA-like protein
MRSLVDVVITSGGVGGTHDDVTIESVAAALNCGMAQHEEMAQLLLKKMNKTDDVSSMSEAQIKMATLPTNAKLRYLSNDPNDWPILQCKNIFILPGIPEFFSKKVRNVAEYLSCQMERLPAYKVVLQVDENSIVPILNKVVENHPNIVFGSYPFVSHPEYQTVITVEGRLATAIGAGRRNSSICDLSMIDAAKASDVDVQTALDDLINRLPDGSVLRVDVDDMRLFS